MKLLLDAGADINAQDERGATALDWAEGGPSERHEKMVAFLKERGAQNGKVRK